MASDMRWNVQATELSRHVLDAGPSLITTPEKVRHPLATKRSVVLCLGNQLVVVGSDRELHWSVHQEGECVKHLHH
ncbi:MAG: hypothetical protein WKF73_09575 [Nocardioidaceae bacterium]